MYARSTTIQAQPSSIDAGIAHVRDEVMPAITGIQGCVGLSLMVDRLSCRCIATSAWDSAEAMRDSESQVRPIRDRLAGTFGGSAQVEEWEIAALHREHRSPEGACVRAIWLKTDPDRIDAAVEAYRSQYLSEMETLEGFCSASLLINRSSGRAVSCATYDSAEAMLRNRDQAATLRADASRRSGAELIDGAEFELAVAHLRVPEMA
ncbi:hypothetical protein [Nocardia miyunensis]|uniref:hypothetical protein n=1 Tax=Nocardia miyunensis TaxID=282684 RepID=UPI000836FFE0|nr:hypothetical protein [Nocardia miyunensis]